MQRDKSLKLYKLKKRSQVVNHISNNCHLPSTHICLPSVFFWDWIEDSHIAKYSICLVLIGKIIFFSTSMVQVLYLSKCVSLGFKIVP